MNNLHKKYHTVIIGGGHNGLVAANYLAMAGKKVLLLEKNDYLGGATTSQKVFPDYDAQLSRYSYLVSLFPKQIFRELGLNINLLQRKIASYTPYVAAQKQTGLLISNLDERRSEESILGLGCGKSEWEGYRRIGQQQAVFAALVWDSFLQPLASKSHFEKVFKDAGHAALWRAFVEEPIGHFIEKNVASDILRGVLMTDAKIGSFTSAYDQSLLQNRTFLYHIVGNKTGEWRVPAGGMGNLSRQLATRAAEKGAKLICNVDVKNIQLGSPNHTVHFELDGKSYAVDTQYVLSNASSQVLEKLLGNQPPKAAFEDEGSAFKINMLLKKLPELKYPNVRSEDAFAGTFHVNQSYAQMEKTFAEAKRGQVPETLAGELYCHTLTDPSILSDELRQRGFHTLTYFGLDLPYRLFISDNQQIKDKVVAKFLTGINQYLAEPMEDCLARDAEGRLCLEAKSAFDLEQDLNLPQGNIFHNALAWFFTENQNEVDTWGVETAHERVFICGSSAKRGGAVSGIPARNAAKKILGENLK